MMKLTDAGRRYIERREELKLVAYQDEGDVWTIGYGHTGPEVKPGLTIMAHQADCLFKEDVADAEDAVDRFFGNLLLPHEFDGIVSWVFNCGRGVLSGDSNHRDTYKYACRTREFLRKTLKEVGESRRVALTPLVEAIGWYINVNGRKNKGLVNRRAADVALILTGNYA